MQSNSQKKYQFAIADKVSFFLKLIISLQLFGRAPTGRAITHTPRTSCVGLWGNRSIPHAAVVLKIIGLQ